MAPPTYLPVCSQGRGQKVGGIDGHPPAGPRANSGAPGAHAVSGMKVGMLMPSKGVNSPRTWAKWISQFRAPQS